MRCSLFVAVVAVAVPFVYYLSTGWLKDAVLNRLGLPRVRRNYENAFVFEPSMYSTPRNTDEIVDLVHWARKEKRRLKVVGAGHSWGAIAVPSDVQVSLREHMSNLISVDKQSKRITVQGGMSLRTLNDICAENGLAMTQNPSVNEPTVAGVISSATHGTGIAKPALASFVVSLTMVTGVGEVKTYGEGGNEELLDAVRVGLGVLGVITQVTLQMETFYRMEEIATPMPVSAWMNPPTGVHAQAPPSAAFDFGQDKLAKLVRAFPEFTKIWFTVTGHSLVYQGKRTNELPRGNMPRWLADLRLCAFELVQWVCSYVPSLTHSALSVLAGPLRAFDHHHRVSRFDDVYNIPARIPMHNELEFSVPFDECARALYAWHQYVQVKRIPVNHIVELRFVAADNVWLSPEYKRESCRITLLLYNRGRAHTDAYFKGYERVLTDMGLAIRPHWAKWFWLNSSDLAAVFPKWDDFAELRKRLDPDDIFLNEWSARLFAP